jgi:hypothetical protein
VWPAPRQLTIRLRVTTPVTCREPAPRQLTIRLRLTVPHQQPAPRQLPRSLRLTVPHQQPAQFQPAIPIPPGALVPARAFHQSAQPHSRLRIQSRTPRHQTNRLLVVCQGHPHTTPSLDPLVRRPGVSLVVVVASQERSPGQRTEPGLPVPFGGNL